MYNLRDIACIHSYIRQEAACAETSPGAQNSFNAAC